MRLGGFEALGEQALVEVDELLFRPPAARRETLRLHELPRVDQRGAIFGITEMAIRLRARTQRDRVAVGVLGRQHILPGRERIEARSEEHTSELQSLMRI